MYLNSVYILDIFNVNINLSNLFLVLLNYYTDIDGRAMINSKHLQFIRAPYGAQMTHKNIKRECIQNRMKKKTHIFIKHKIPWKAVWHDLLTKLY